MFLFENIFFSLRKEIFWLVSCFISAIWYRVFRFESEKENSLIFYSDLMSPLLLHIRSFTKFFFFLVLFFIFWFFLGESKPRHWRKKSPTKTDKFMVTCQLENYHWGGQHLTWQRVCTPFYNAVRILELFYFFFLYWGESAHNG